MKKCLIAFAFVLLMAVGLMATASAENIVEYALEGGKIYFDKDIGTITQCTLSVTRADIPSEIGGVRVTSIGYKAFFGCFRLTSVTIPDSVTSIGSVAFSGCFSLTSVTIPNSVTSIGTYAFNDCKSLRSVTVGNGVTSIGQGVFLGCTSLTSVTIPSGVTSIGNGAFQSCASLTSVTIPSGVTSIGSTVFYGCTSLTSVTIPSSVTSIGLGAFCNCTSLTSVTIPDSLTSIETTVFSGCSSLTSVTIPGSVTSIRLGAFYECTSLTDVYYSGTEEQWHKINIGSDNQALTSANIHYNSGDSVKSANVVPSGASGFFTDVPQDSYYFDAVKWAVEKGVTNGTSSTTFSPGNTCTRGQVVTFFWRNAGQPEPSSQNNPFFDVQEDSYYYKAALWAVERGITNGTSTTTFSPNQPCTYAHIVTFLWRLKYPMESNPGGETWYAIPAAWSDAHGLLTGTNFVPNQPCPRSDIVTYLYRNSIEVSTSMQESEYLTSAIISAHSDGHTLWTHTTEKYELTELTTIEEIGAFGDQYVYVEDGSVVALDVNTGAVRWTNDDFIGGVADYCVGTNGVLYLCSSEGYGFFGVDMAGNTVGGIGHFYENENLFLPINIQRVDESHMSVGVSGFEWPYDKKAFLVDLHDFSYSGPFDRNDPRVTPSIGPFLSGAWIRTNMEDRNSRIDVEQIGDLYLFDVSWKGGGWGFFSGKWENGAIRYTNGSQGYRDEESEGGQTGTVRLSGNTLLWTTDNDSSEMDYIRWYDP